MAKILVVEDDPVVANIIRDCLKTLQYLTEIASDATDAREFLRTRSYDLLVLDWELPGGATGVEICREVRKRGGAMPILMLTGKREIDDKEAGLDAGADDYLVKPFSTRELAARIRALLRRPAALVSTVLKVGDLEMDPTAHTVRRGQAELTMQPQEFALLEFLMRNPGQVFSAAALLERVWPSDKDVAPDVVTSRIAKLRAKIDQDGGKSLIVTVPRLGYKLEP